MGFPKGFYDNGVEGVAFSPNMAGDMAITVDGDKLCGLLHAGVMTANITRGELQNNHRFIGHKAWCYLMSNTHKRREKSTGGLFEEINEVADDWDAEGLFLDGWHGAMGWQLNHFRWPGLLYYQAYGYNQVIFPGPNSEVVGNDQLTYQHRQWTATMVGQNVYTQFKFLNVTPKSTLQKGLYEGCPNFAHTWARRGIWPSLTFPVMGYWGKVKPANPNGCDGGGAGGPAPGGNNVRLEDD